MIISLRWLAATLLLALTGCAAVSSQPAALLEASEAPSGNAYFLPRMTLPVSLTVVPSTGYFEASIGPTVAEADTEHSYYLQHNQNPFANDDINIETDPETGLLRKVYVTAEDRLPQIILKALGQDEERNVQANTDGGGAEALMLLTGLRLDPEAAPESPYSREHIEQALSQAVRDYARTAHAICRKDASALHDAASLPARSVVALELLQKEIEVITARADAVKKMEELISKITALDALIAKASGEERVALNKQRDGHARSLTDQAAALGIPIDSASAAGLKEGAKLLAAKAVHYGDALKTKKVAKYRRQFEVDNADVLLQRADKRREAGRIGCTEYARIARTTTPLVRLGVERPRVRYRKATPDECARGICYRAPLPYSVSLAFLGSRTKFEQRFSLPNASPVVVLDVQRAVGVKKITEIDFDPETGLLDKIHVSQPSSVEAIAGLPIQVAKALFTIPTEFLQLKINLVQKQASLAEELAKRRINADLAADKPSRARAMLRGGNAVPRVAPSLGDGVALRVPGATARAASASPEGRSQVARQEQANASKATGSSIIVQEP